MTASDVETEVFPKIWQALGWIVAYFVLQIFVTIATTVIAAGGDVGLLASLSGGLDKAGKAASAVVAVGGIWGLVLSGALTVGLVLLHLQKPGRKEAIGLFAPSALPIARTLGIAVLLLALAYAFNWLYSTYVVPGVELQADVKKLLAAVPRTPFNMVVLFLAAAVIAPLVEEILFRGYLQTSLKSRLGGTGAILVAAFLFALVHMQPLAMPGLFALGAAFGYIYEKTGSLKTNILLHVANNALAVAFM